MSRSGRQQAGLTLLEILVGLAVLGFLMLAIVQGLRFGLLSWDHQSREITRVGEQAAASDALRHLIEAIEPGTDTDPVPVVGSADRLAFRTKMPMSANPFGPRQIDALLGLDGSGRLLLRWTPYVNAVRLADAPPPQEALLLNGVRAMEFWFRPLPESSPPVWQRTWTLREMPGLIKIRLILSEPSRDGWPEIVAAPRRDRRVE